MVEINRIEIHHGTLAQPNKRQCVIHLEDGTQAVLEDQRVFGPCETCSLGITGRLKTIQYKGEKPDDSLANLHIAHCVSDGQDPKKVTYVEMKPSDSDNGKTSGWNIENATSICCFPFALINFVALFAEKLQKNE